MTRKLKIVWSSLARQHLKEAYEYIKKDSVQNARKVRADITAIVKSLPNHPGKYAPDKLKRSNDGSFRVFEKHKYRIVYRVLDDEIRILRVRHVKREPQRY